MISLIALTAASSAGSQFKDFKELVEEGRELREGGHGHGKLYDKVIHAKPDPHAYVMPEKDVFGSAEYTGPSSASLMADLQKSQQRSEEWRKHNDDERSAQAQRARETTALEARVEEANKRLDAAAERLSARQPADADADAESLAQVGGRADVEAAPDLPGLLKAFEAKRSAIMQKGKAAIEQHLEGPPDPSIWADPVEKQLREAAQTLKAMK